MISTPASPETGPHEDDSIKYAGKRTKGVLMQIRHAAILFSLVPCALVACAGDDITEVAVDAGPRRDATLVDAPNPPDALAPDASDASDAAPPPAQRVLVTHTTTGGELVAIDLSSGKVDGRLAFKQFGFAQGGAIPYLIESNVDTVARLDPSQPWSITSTWNVAGNDMFDGGENYADPVQVIQTAPNKAYVLRYNRNAIAVFDPSQTADGGAASQYISVQSLLQAGDKDGHVDMAGAIYDSTRHRIYIALANIDLGLVDPQGYFQLCSPTTSTLIALDTMTDKLVDLGGSGPGGSVVLKGRSPQLALSGGMAYDAVGDRVLVMSTGCNPVLGDGGTGALTGRLIEAITLKDNTTQTLLDLNAADFPGQLVYIEQHTAYVQLGFPPYASVFAWDPATTKLGQALPIAPDTFAYDPKNNALVGPITPILSDGGVAPAQVVSVSLSDAGSDASTVKVLAPNPFTEKGGYFGNATLY